MKAYLVSSRGFADGIVWSTTRGKAFWSCVRSYVECFGGTPKQALKKLKIKRAPEYDNIKHKPNTLIDRGLIDGDQNLLRGNEKRKG